MPVSERHDSDCVRVHYLGHAAFVLRFGGVTVLADYGRPNAWAPWGWDSPIHDIGQLVPDVATYSHTHHDDHYDAERLPDGVPVILKGGGPTQVGALRIEPICMHEQGLDEADSAAYLFTYRGARVVHLGDCQADIISIDDPAHRATLQRALPRECDLLLMPIESQQQFFAQAQTFVRLLRPKRLLPMHFWSERALQRFVDLMRSEAEVEIENCRRAQVMFRVGALADGIRIILLDRAPFRGWRV